MTRHNELVKIQSIYEAQDLINRYCEWFKQSRGIYWAITKKENDQLIGTCGLKEWDLENKRAEVKCAIRCECWGKGYGLEAVERLVQYGFEHMGLKRIGALVLPENKPYIRILEKLGFELEGEMKSFFIKEDESLNPLSFSLVHHN